MMQESMPPALRDALVRTDRALDLSRRMTDAGAEVDRRMEAHRREPTAARLAALEAARFRLRSLALEARALLPRAR